MAGKSKLTADEAREYSGSLAKAAAGDYELMDFAINTLGVPQALGMEPGEWVDSIGGYIRLSVEDRRKAVKQLKEEKRTVEQTATILGIGRHTVERDRAVLKVIEETPSQEGEKPQIGPGSPSQEGGKRESVAQQRPQIRDMIDEGKSDAQIALALGRGVATIQKERVAYKRERGETPEPKGLTEGEASAMLEGRLASIELGALNLAAWWRQHGKEALAGSDLAWVDETIAHTKEKVSMILDSVRGVDANADAALAQWAAEAEGRDS